ncbi:MAG: hypothetical protein J7L99_07835 [Planctomycetes bacterium]|nr:hypothetical protein [Planctomycetota bacterium]
MSLLKRTVRPRRSKIRPLLRQTSPARTVFFTITNLVGFAFVNAFFYYLMTGKWFDFSSNSYKSALACPLSSIFVEPLSIFTHPWMILVSGLVLTAIISVPILVAVLYRLGVSALFVLTVAVIGHAPLLAIFIAIGCLLAGMTRLRNEVPFLATLAGLALIGLYWFFFSGIDQQTLSPFEKLTLHLAFIISMITAVIAEAVVLSLARLARFRPGVIWPVLLTFLVAPIWLFYQKVGPAELEYALIIQKIVPGETIIAPIKPAFLNSSEWKNLTPTTTSTSTTQSTKPTEEKAKLLLAYLQDQLKIRQQKLIKKCRKFLRRYPRHRRTPTLLWIIATVIDIQIDTDAFLAGKLRYYYAGPSDESLILWEQLAEQFPQSPQSLIAHQRLGIGALREERIQKALEHLRTAQSLIITYLEQPRAETTLSKTTVFAPDQPVPSKEYYRKVLFQTDTILWLMEMNEIIDGKPQDIEAFAQYMKLWPFIGVSRIELQDLAKAFNQTKLADNFRLQAALTIKNPLDRAIKLSHLANQVNDAAILANYELGCLAVQFSKTPAWTNNHLKSADYYFKVVKNAQENPYIAAAEKQLRWINLSKRAKVSQ